MRRGRRLGRATTTTSRGQTDGSGVGLCLAITDTRLPITVGLARTGDRFKVHHHVITKDLILRHNVKVVAVPVLVGGARVGTPLLIAIVRTQVGDHHNDALSGYAAGAAVFARRFAGGSKFITFTTAGATPVGTRGVEECLRACCRVDSIADTELGND